VIATLVSRLLGLCHSLLLTVFALAASLKRPSHRKRLDLAYAGPGEPERKLLLPRSKLDMKGIYGACVVTWSLKTEIVNQILPRMLELAPQDWTAPGLHPVLFMFGRQSNVRPNFVPVPGLFYEELIVAIPYIQWRDDRYAYRGPYVYPPRLYLDHLLPTLLGWIPGYPKRLARIRAEEHTFQVSHLFRDQPVIHARFSSKGEPRPMGDFPLFSATAAMLGQPILGKAFLVGPFVGTFLNFELERALIQPADAELWIDRQFLGGLPVGKIQTPGIDEVPLGAFRFIVPWNVGPPFMPSSPIAIRTDTTGRS
jgi:Acetoacetate decarboxylase (ADC)